MNTGSSTSKKEPGAQTYEAGTGCELPPGFWGGCGKVNGDFTKVGRSPEHRHTRLEQDANCLLASGMGVGRLTGTSLRWEGKKENLGFKDEQKRR